MRPGDLKRLVGDWQVWARDEQLPPSRSASGPQPWRTWLFLGGRGAGKTRAGAEWVHALAMGEAPFADRPVTPIALVGETKDAARAVMVEGVSGLLAVAPPELGVRFETSKNRVVWPNGSTAHIFSAATPAGLRGPQFAAAWCDEMCKWRHPQSTWDMLQFGLRLGDWPRQLVTTTPKTMPLLRALLDDPVHTVVTRAATSDNAANLADGFAEMMAALYGGSVMARQELAGEFLEQADGALWSRALLDRIACDAVPDLSRVVVAVDPPVTSHAGSDACGLVVAAKGTTGEFYVLHDGTLQGAAPHVWAQAAVDLFHAHQCDLTVAEVNQGGELVTAMLHHIDPCLPVRTVHARRGKYTRAEPIAALYARGLVRHVRSANALNALEDEMCNFTRDGLPGGRSPDRVDALVWALTDLAERAGSGAQIRYLGQ